MAICREFCTAAKIGMIGVPKTIDNDAPFTEQAVGFATARQVCVESLDRLDTTGASHHRVMILEVMGRDAGHIALHTAVAGGADVCLIPEIAWTYKGMVEKLKEMRRMGAKHSLVVVAEGVKTEDGTALVAEHADGERYIGIGNYLESKLSADPAKFSSRVTVLGHVQRGGSPCAFDRLIATALGVKAVNLLSEGQNNLMVVWQGGKVGAVPLSDVAKAGTAKVDVYGDMVRTAREIGIYVGEEVKAK